MQDNSQSQWGRKVSCGRSKKEFGLTRILRTGYSAVGEIWTFQHLRSGQECRKLHSRVTSSTARTIFLNSATRAPKSIIFNATLQSKRHELNEAPSRSRGEWIMVLWCYQLCVRRLVLAFFGITSFIFRSSSWSSKFSKIAILARNVTVARKYLESPKSKQLTLDSMIKTNKSISDSQRMPLASRKSPFDKPPSCLITYSSPSR